MNIDIDHIRLNLRIIRNLPRHRTEVGWMLINRNQHTFIEGNFRTGFIRNGGISLFTSRLIGELIDQIRIRHFNVNGNNI